MAAAQDDHSFFKSPPIYSNTTRHFMHVQDGCGLLGSLKLGSFELSGFFEHCILCPPSDEPPPPMQTSQILLIFGTPIGEFMPGQSPGVNSFPKSGSFDTSLSRFFALGLVARLGPVDGTGTPFPKFLGSIPAKPVGSMYETGLPLT